jgi:hypothetical protein
MKFLSVTVSVFRAIETIKKKIECTVFFQNKYIVRLFSIHTQSFKV